MNQKKAVMQVCLSLETGGLERLVVNLANQLALTAPVESHICTVGTTTNTVISSTIMPAVRWTDLHGPPFCNLNTAWRLIQEVRRHRIELLHAHGSNPLVYALAASMATGVPIVFTKHSTYDDIGFFKRRRWFRFLARHRVSKFIGVTQAATAMLAEVFRPPADRYETILNGTVMPPAAVCANATFNRERKQTQNAPFIIATVCRLAPEKDITTLLWAFAKVTESVPHCELWIVGDGPEKEKLMALAVRLNIAEKVTFHGFSGHVQDLLAQADLFVNSSITEGISLSILEAMSLGLPVVATDVGGTPDIVIPGENGILSTPRSPQSLAEGIIRLAKNHALCLQMGKHSAHLARKHWSLERMAESYWDLYQGIMDAGTGSKIDKSRNHNIGDMSKSPA